MTNTRAFGGDAAATCVRYSRIRRTGVPLAWRVAGGRTTAARVDRRRACIKIAQIGIEEGTRIPRVVESGRDPGAIIPTLQITFLDVLQEEHFNVSDFTFR